MRDLLYVEDLDQAASLLHPLRVQLLKLMAEPRTCNELAEAVGESPQKVYYHVKILEKGGLVEKTSEERVRGVMQGYYQARARSYWFSPGLVGRLGGRRRTQDRLSLDFLLSLAETLQADIGALARQAAPETPSLGLSGQITLRDAGQRAEFMQDVQAMFQTLARKYGRHEDEPALDAGPIPFTLMLACYPNPAADAAKDTA